MNKTMAGLLVLGLVVGLAGGYGGGFAVCNPQVLRLQSDLSQTQSALSDSQSEVESLQGELTQAQANISSLQTSLVKAEETIGDLQSQLSQRDEEILGLQNELTQKNNQIGRLQEQISDLIIELRNLNQSYQALQAIYEELLNDYRMLNAPVSAFVSAADLDFTITTHQRIYGYKDPVSGNVTIYYNNGTAFKGKFSIYIERIGYGVTSGWTFNVNGYGKFNVNPPAFTWGPGTYRIGLLWLYDSEGYTIATPNEIRHIYVTVEAK